MKFFVKPIFLLVMFLFLTAFTFIASGELNRRSESMLRKDGTGRKINTVQRSKKYQNKFSLQKYKRSMLMTGNNNLDPQATLPKCCYQTESRIDKRIDLHRKFIKTLRSCKAKKRAICGPQDKSDSKAYSEPIVEALIQQDVQDLEKATTTTITDNMYEETEHDEIDMIGKHWLEPVTYEIENKNYDSENKVIRVLAEKCLLAMMTYLDYYGRGAGEIKELLGKVNLEKMMDIKIQKNCADRRVNFLWHVTDIVGILKKCQNDAASDGDFELYSICSEIERVIRSNYDIKDRWITEFEEEGNVIVC